MKIRLNQSLRAALMASYALAAPVATTLSTVAMTTGALAVSFSLQAQAEEVDEDVSTSLGNVMFVGDSITHGTDSSSYRWALHKIFADNGISYTAVGKWSTCYSTAYNQTSYGGQAYSNVHSAYYSTRADEMLTEGFRDTSRTTLGSILATTDEVDNFFMLIGTNDFLSDYADSNYENDSDFAYTEALNTLSAVDSIVTTMLADSPDATISLMTVPTFTDEQSVINADATFAAVSLYNYLLLSAYDDADNVTVYNTNVGLSDVTLAYETTYTTSDGDVITYTVDSQMHDDFTYESGDAVHLSDQASLIVASNLAKALGYAGRTAGQSRLDASSFAVNVTSGVSNDTLSAAGFTVAGVTDTSDGVSLGDASSISYTWDSDSILQNGYTLDLSLDLGNGSTDGWDTDSMLSINLSGAGVQGTLVISEGYIMWEGNTVDNAGNVIQSNDAYSVLYSYDMSTLSDLGDLRIAYVAADEDNNLAGGYYVWIDDMLIGEALTTTDYFGDEVGVEISYNGDGTVSITSIAVDGDAAYSPTTTGITTDSGYVADYSFGGTGMLDEWAEGVTQTGSVSALSSNIRSAAGFTSGDASITVVDAGKVSSNVFANDGAYTGTLYVDIQSGGISSTNWYGVQNSGTLTGDAYLKFSGDATGTGGTVFGVLGGTIDGDLYMEFSAEDASYGSYTTGTSKGSVASAYTGTVTGSSTIVINAGTFNYNILGGASGSDNALIAGGTSIYINGGTINANVVGGGHYGTVGTDGVTSVATSITINGGSIDGNVYGGSDLSSGAIAYGDVDIIITGGSITGDVVGGGLAGTINGDTSITIAGSDILISGDIYAGANGGTVTGTSTLTIQNLRDTDSETGFDAYSGTISGDSLIFDDVRVDAFSATLSDFSSLEVKGYSSLSLDGTESIALSTLTVSEASQLSLTADATIATVCIGESSALTLSGNSSITTLSIGESGTLTLSGTSSITTWTRGQDSTLALTDGAKVTVNGGATSYTSAESYTSIQSDFNVELGVDSTLSENRQLWIAAVDDDSTQVVNINGSGTYELTSLLLRYSNTGDVELNINDDATLHITNTKTTTSNAYAGFVTSGAGTDGESYTNIYGTLQLDSGIVAFSSGNGTITVKDGGDLVLNRGTLSYSNGGSITIKVEEDGTVQLGNTIDDSYNAASSSDDLSVLTLNMADGAILYGTGVSFTADGFVTTDTTDVYQSLTVATDATINLGTDSAKVMNIYSSIANGSVNVSSGTVNLVAGGSLSGLSVASGATAGVNSSLSLTGSATLNGGTLNSIDGSLNLDVIVASSSALSSDTGSLALNSNLSISVDNVSLDLSGAGSISLGDDFSLTLELSDGTSSTILTGVSSTFDIAESCYDSNDYMLDWVLSDDGTSYDLVATESQLIYLNPYAAKFYDPDGNQPTSKTDTDYTIVTAGSTDRIVLYNYAGGNTSFSTALSVYSVEIGNKDADTEGSGTTIAYNTSLTSATTIVKYDESIFNLNGTMTAADGITITNGAINMNGSSAKIVSDITITGDGSLTSSYYSIAALNDESATINLTDNGGSITQSVITGATITGAELTINSGTQIINSTLINSALNGDLTVTSSVSLINTVLEGGLTIAGGSLTTDSSILSNDVSITAAGGSISTVDAADLTLNSVFTFSDANYSLDLGGAGDIAIGDDFGIVFSTELTTGSYEIFTNVSNDFSGSISSSMVTGIADGNGVTWAMVENNLTVTVAVISSDVVWNSESNTWVDSETGETAAAASDSNLSFSSGSEDAGDVSQGEITITGATEAADVTFSGDNDMTMTAEGSLSSSTTITKEGDSTLITGQSLSADEGIAVDGGIIELTGSGSIDSTTTIAEGASVTAGTITVTGTSDGTELSDGGLSVDTLSSTTVSNAEVAITGDAVLSESTIAENSIVEVSQGTLNVDDSMTIAANGDNTASISLGSEGSLNADGISDASISGATLTIKGTEASAASISTFSLVLKSGPDEVVESDGTTTISNSSISSTKIVMESNSTLNLDTVSLAADTSIVAEIGASIAAKDLIVNADSLTVSDNSIDVDTFAGVSSVTLTGELNMNLILDSDDYVALITALESGEAFTVNLIGDNIDIDGLVGATITVSSEEMLDIVFDATNTGVADSDSVTFSVSSSDVIPEPSTATLSLLALAGLLARRRRTKA